MNGFDHYDAVLNLLKTERYNGFTCTKVIELTGVKNAQEILNQMESNGLVFFLPRHTDSELDYMITPAGLGITVLKGGYYQFVNEIVKENDELKKKQELEIKKLTHDVSISKIQFWLFVIGSILGIIGFVFSMISFYLTSFN